MPFLPYDQFDAGVRSGKIGSLIMLDGPELWLKEAAVKRIIKKLLPPEAFDFNLEKFDGKSASGGDICSSASSLPFLAERRVVIVNSAEEFGAADSKLIAEAVPSFPKTTCLLFLYLGKANLREEIPAAVNSYGTMVTCWTPFPNQLPGWVVGETKARGKSISYDAAEALAEACSDLQEISNELDKLILFVGKKPTITYDDLEEHGLPDEAGDQRRLEEALYRRDLKECLRQEKLLSEAGIRAEAVFPTFERIFRNLILARFYSEKKGMPLAEIFTVLRMRGRTQQDNLSAGLRAYNNEELQEALQRIVDAELNLKTGIFDSDISLTFLVLNVVRKRALALS